MFGRKRRRKNAYAGSLASYVAAGIEWFDEVAGEGWRDRIDLERLSFPSSTDCPLGQLRLWGEAQGEAEGEAEGFAYDHMWLGQHGFSWPPGSPPDLEWGDLTNEWRKQIEEARR